jgi:ketosteroid isomerase-like protein
MELHPNEALIHRAWQAVADGDVEELQSLVAEKACWTATGANPWAGRHEGFDEIVDLLARVGEEMDAFDANIVDTLVSEERVLVIYHVAAAIGKYTLDCHYLLLSRVENGTIVDLWSCAMEPGALQKFWSQMPPIAAFSAETH